MVAGRLADIDAPDELVVGEVAARAGDIRVGDTLRISSWDQADLDAAIDGHLVPSTPGFESKVVGVVRYLGDVQQSTEGDSGEHFLPSLVYAGAGWSEAHADSIAGNGTSVAVRLSGGVDAQPELEAALGEHDWFALTEPAVDVDLSALRRSLDVERAAEWIAGGVAALAAAVLLGLTLFAQLRREMQDAALLRALGMTRRDLVLGTSLRAATILLPAGVIAIVIVSAASPLGPYGVAHRLEFDHPVLFDPRVAAALAFGLVVLGLAAAELAATRAGRRQPRPKVRSTRPLPFGPIVRSGLTFARGGPPDPPSPPWLSGSRPV